MRVKRAARPTATRDDQREPDEQRHAEQCECARCPHSCRAARSPRSAGRRHRRAPRRDRWRACRAWRRSPGMPKTATSSALPAPIAKPTAQPIRKTTSIEPSGLRRKPLDRHEGAHRDDGADREIDLAGDDDQRLADRDDADERRRQRDVLEVGGLEEARLAQRHQRADDEKRHDQDQLAHAQAAVPRNPREVSGRRDRRRVGGSGSCGACVASRPARHAPRRAGSLRDRRHRARISAAIAAAPEDQDAVGHRHHLLGVVADQDDGDSLGREMRDDAVNFGLGADVDAARRLVEDERSAASGSATWRAAPSADCRRRACSSPARRRSRRPASAWRNRAASFALLWRGRPGRACRIARRSTGSVALERIGNCSTSPCWWRSSGRNEMPSRMASPRRARIDHAAIDPDLAAVGPGDAEEHLGDLGAAGADEAEEAEDLAGAKLEAHVLDEDRAGKAAYAEHRLADLRLLLREEGCPARCRSCGGRSARRSAPAVGRVATRLPERRIVTSSPQPRISSRKWLMKRMRDALLS